MRLTQKDLTEFITYLVELGGYFKVDKDHYITLTKTGERYTIVDSGTEDEYPIKVYHIDRIPGDEWVMNPFKQQLPKKRKSNETMSIEPDKQFLYSTIDARIQNFYRDVVASILAMDTESDEYRKLVNMLGVLPTEDTMKDDWGKMDMEDVIGIQDDCATGNIYRAYLVSHLDNEDLFKTKYKSKIRKKSWIGFQKLMAILLKSNPEDLEENYTSTSNLDSKAPTAEAYITIFCQFLVAIQPIVELTTKENYQLEYFKQNLVNIPQFQRMSFFSDGILRKPQEISVQETPANNEPVTTASQTTGYLYPHQMADQATNQWLPHQLPNMGNTPTGMYPHQQIAIQPHQHHMAPYPQQPAPVPYSYYQQPVQPAYGYPYTHHVTHPQQPVQPAYSCVPQMSPNVTI